jgi:hypothetical protein
MVPEIVPFHFKGGFNPQGNVEVDVGGKNY